MNLEAHKGGTSGVAVSPATRRWGRGADGLRREDGPAVRRRRPVVARQCREHRLEKFPQEAFRSVRHVAHRRHIPHLHGACRIGADDVLPPIAARSRRAGEEVHEGHLYVGAASQLPPQDIKLLLVNEDQRDDQSERQGTLPAGANGADALEAPLPQAHDANFLLTHPVVAACSMDVGIRTRFVESLRLPTSVQDGLQHPHRMLPESGRLVEVYYWDLVTDDKYRAALDGEAGVILLI